MVACTHITTSTHSNSMCASSRHVPHSGTTSGPTTPPAGLVVNTPPPPTAKTASTVAKAPQGGKKSAKGSRAHGPGVSREKEKVDPTEFLSHVTPSRIRALIDGVKVCIFIDWHAQKRVVSWRKKRARPFDHMAM